MNLTKCPSCSKEISTLAETCPSCGAPNEWIHPDIEKFLSEKDSIAVPEDFTFEYKKTAIWGETEEKVPWWLWLVVIFCSVPGLAFGVIPALIIAPITYFILIAMYGKKESFTADLKNRSWESSNDEFWEAVKSTLKL